jgi:hypothetical protein
MNGSACLRGHIAWNSNLDVIKASKPSAEFYSDYSASRFLRNYQWRKTIIIEDSGLFEVYFRWVDMNDMNFSRVFQPIFFCRYVINNMACGRSEEEQQSAWCQWVMQGSSVEWFHSVPPQGGVPDRFLDGFGVRFGCWKMLKDVEKCWKMLKDVERCWKMLKDVERCWKMLKDDTLW